MYSCYCRESKKRRRWSPQFATVFFGENRKRVGMQWPPSPPKARPNNSLGNSLNVIPTSETDVVESRVKRCGQPRHNLKRPRPKKSRRGVEFPRGAASRKPLLVSLCLLLIGQGMCEVFGQGVKPSQSRSMVDPGDAGFQEGGQRENFNVIHSERSGLRRQNGWVKEKGTSSTVQRGPKDNDDGMLRSGGPMESMSMEMYTDIYKPSDDRVSGLRELSSDDADTFLLRTNSDSFVLVLSAFLACIVVFRLFLFFSVVHHRRQTTIQLAQPAVLAIFVLAGAAAAASCVLFVPLSDLRCRLREPFLITSINLMAVVLVGRVWRISVLVGPALLQIGEQPHRTRDLARMTRTGQIRPPRRDSRDSFAQDLTTSALSCCIITCSRSKLTEQLEPVRQIVMDILAFLSDVGVVRDCFVRIAVILCRGNSCMSGMQRRDELRRRRRRESIRQAIPTKRLLWLIFVLMIPQLILQACNLMLPSLVSHRVVHIYDEELMLGRYECRHTVGTEWTTIVGIILTAVPCATTVFLSLWSDGLPPVLNEAGAVKKSSVAFVMMTSVSAPALAITGDPDARAYLKTMLVLALVLPPCWFLLIARIYNAWRREQKRTFHDLLRRERPPSDRPSSNNMDTSSGKNETNTNAVTGTAASETHLCAHVANHAKTATLALTIGKMYENMGATSKCLNLFDEALDLWKVDPGRKRQELIGGFTEDEINAFTSSDLDFIIQLLIAKGRVQGTYNSTKEKGIKISAQAWVDALDVYERASSSVALSDRAILFPVFSGLYVFLKGGKVKDDEDCTFKQDLVYKFVRETRIYGDPVHYQRALAMQAEVNARLGRYQQALNTVQILAEMYVPEEHSDRMCSIYGTDHSAKSLSQSALWRVQLLQWDEAIEMCEYVISDLVPKMDPANILGMTELLLPVIKILKGKGQAGRMRDLFNEHVVQACWKHLGKDANTPSKPLFKPMLCLLDYCDEERDERPALYPNVYDCIDWILDGDNCVPPEFLDTVFTKSGYSPSSISAELCLRLSNQITDCNPDKRKLLEKGLRLARDADDIISDEAGNVRLPIPNNVNEPLLRELEERLEVLQELDATANIDSDAKRRSSQTVVRNIVTPQWLKKSEITLKSLDAPTDTSGHGSDDLGNSKSRRRCSIETGAQRSDSPGFADNSDTRRRSESMCFRRQSSIEDSAQQWCENGTRRSTPPSNGVKSVTMSETITVLDRNKLLEVQCKEAASVGWSVIGATSC